MKHLETEFERAREACNQLAELRHAPDVDWRELLKILNLHERQAKLLMSLGTKLRITVQARVSAKVAGTDVQNNPTLPNPWANQRGKQQ